MGPSFGRRHRKFLQPDHYTYTIIVINKIQDAFYIDQSKLISASIKTKSPDPPKHQRVQGIKKSDRRDSNPRSPPWQGGALPAKLLSHLVTCALCFSTRM